ncbi:hypothetical protein H6786_03490 [Candidatus Nomurabacteria bacterium]|nr:hypothetical protein [Candidatus Nomurabacteria bacterium]
MTRKIRITKVPPGFAPESIREQWVGIEIPTISDEEATAHQDDEEWTSQDHNGAHLVTGHDACQALLEAGKLEAASFWRNPWPPQYLRFDQSCYEVIEEE